MSTSLENPRNDRPTPEPEEGQVEISAGQIAYLDWKGPGPQIHFLHANGFCAGTYAPFLKPFFGSFRVVASDVRGHGKSVMLQAAPIRHWKLFAQDLKVLIERRMAPPVIGIGHSLGAVTTYIAAATYPHLFSCIVLIDPVILPRPLLWMLRIMRLLGLIPWVPLARKARRRKKIFKNKQEAFQRFASGRGIFRSWSEEFVGAYLECGLLEKSPESAILTCDPELEAQIFESIPLNIWSYAASVQCPVLALRGEHSDTFLPGAAARFQRILPDAKLWTVPGTGHFLPMEKPGDCARLILQFIRSHFKTS